MLFLLRHLGGKFFWADGFDPVDTGLTVGAEDQAENFRKKVVEFLAIGGAGKIRAVRAAGNFLLFAAGARLAPQRLFVFSAPGTLAVQISFARPAIQAAESD